MSTKRIISTQLVRHFLIGPQRHFTYNSTVYPHWSLLCAEEGAYRFGVGELEGEAWPGDLILIPPHIEFRRKSHTPMSAHYFIFDWIGRDGHKLLTTEEAGLPSGKTTIRDLNRLATSCQYLRDRGDMYEGDDDFVNHLLQDMLYLLRLEADSEQPAHRKDPLMHEAAAYIRKHAGSPLSMQLLAANAGLSQSQFTRRFQASLGTLPTSYMTRIRLQLALDYLLQTDKKLDEIAELCGYQNGFYFSRVFTKVMKTSPSAYRRTHQI